VAGLLLYGFSHTNQIYEGVSLGGIDVGGMSRSAARSAVRSEFSTAANSPILLVADDKKFYFDPNISGITIDTEASLDAAFQYGRSGSIWTRTQAWASALVHGRDVPMQLELDLPKIDATLQGAASQLVRDPQAAYLTYDEQGNATVVPELPGISFDTEATRQVIIERVIEHSSEPVTLVTSIQQADTVAEDLESGLSQIQQVMQSPLEVEGLNSSWTIDPAQMQSLLSYKKGDETIAVDQAGVEAFVDRIAKAVDRSPADAGITVDDHGKLAALPGRIGIAVDRTAATNAIVDALQNDEHKVELVYTSTEPEISDETATAAAAQGETLLDKGVKVTWDGGSVTLDRGDLLKALTVRIRDGQANPFVFGFDPAMFEQQLEQTFKNIDVPVQEPRLRLVDGRSSPNSRARTAERSMSTRPSPPSSRRPPRELAAPN